MSPLYSELRDGLLREYDAGEARAVALLVLEEEFGVPRTDVYAGKVRHFSDAERARLQNISERLQAGEPVQYVTGHAAFMGRRFAVSPAVLIPRPETEELVALALREPARRVLDVGTGSGCVAVSLALELPGAEVEAWDLSDDALAVARTNAAALGAAVRFVRRDALAAPEAGEAFDLIVSNPPYVRESERAGMERRVAEHEPAMALFVPDDDALRFYRALARLGRARLRPGGRLVMEVNAALAGATAALMRAEGYGGVAVSRDAYGRERFVEARLAAGAD